MSAANPLVSVVVPVYNGGRFLREALANIRAQNYDPLEIVVVDDGSTDDTPEVIAGLPAGVRTVRQANQGPAAARNAGVRVCAGDIVAFLDVDDLWPEGRLQAMVDRLLEDDDCAAVRGYVRLVRLQESDGTPSGPMLGPWLGSAIYRRDVFQRVGLFDAGLRYSEDLDWFFRAREQGVSVAIVERTTLHVRRHDQNMTRGRDCHDLNVLRVLKRSLDRRRQGGGDAPVLQRPEADLGAVAPFLAEAQAQRGKRDA